MGKSLGRDGKQPPIPCVVWLAVWSSLGALMIGEQRPIQALCTYTCLFKNQNSCSGF
jgi:hypothetical protein